ncbi:bifunctional metallophosphatase/5'-nucleotidase [Enterococcus hulanensis]|uniref:Bifunctional metallophosphatase/5'-nucleotidase n=1 Tax=Enterococcus hulanensis TaxID=2559929 RepID=A0ABU3F6E0_9ENTE|nr:bifunctional metallophosphatase/5'-nucleotidase [Enterococcus hulanensis]MDT2602511.1 bifunctional metallophosphatase/5'-nucleotidase [Enterococcus hulanensis]MDT2611906.1 bifunctional metallophosphatase/5'-nucleotidase [Enterococcus hulanensis]MDT2630583.1 bifunctional metallophosphatase/5'-nucleotidase [Enterococcus hulanensis]
MRKPSLIRSAVTLFTVLGFTLPAGLAAAETINSTTSNQISETINSSTTAETSTSSAASSQSSEAAPADEAAVVSSSAVEKAPKSATTVPIQMLGINDFHGALSTTGSYYGADGAKVSGAGTAALLAGYFSKAEENFKSQNSDGKTLRVQAGDMVGASPANSGLLQDQPTMRILNQMKFDVGTLGNHEFDEGLGEFNRILTGAKPGSDAGFYDIVNDYNNDYTPDQLKGGFDLVIANVHEKKTGNIPYGWRPYIIKNVGTQAEPINIGFIGVVTQEIPNLVLAQYHKDYDFTDPAEAIAEYSKELVDQKVNAIVVLGHTPSVQGTGDSVSGETADIINRVNQIDPDNSVDAFFAGHNHVYTNGVVGNTRVVQSTSQGKGYIDLQGEYDTTTNDFAETPKATVSAVDPNGGVAPDSAVQAIVADADDRVKGVTEEKIGTADKAEDITRTVNEMGESPVGNLVTDAQVYMAKKNGEAVDFAMTNNGGIRDDLKVKSDATITWGAAQAVQPFGNIMQIVEMTGQQIKNVLNQQTSKYFLQVSGLKYTVEKNPDENDTDHPYVVKELKKADGTVIEASTTYKLIINDFLYGGGDGFSEFTNAKLAGALDPDTETFIGYIEDLEANNKTVSASIEGRKTLAVTDPAKEETEKIKAETKLDEYREGDKNLTGKTIPNGEVTIASTKARALPRATADKDGNFSVAVDQLGLKEGQEVTVTIAGENGGEASFTLNVLPMQTTTTTTSSSTDSSTSQTTSTTTQTSDPLVEETTLIEQKTKLNELFEGDKYLTGETIPNATIEVAVAEDKAEQATKAEPQAKIAEQAEDPLISDEDGKFKIDVQNMNLKAGQDIAVMITGPNGGKASFSTRVLAKPGTNPAADAETEKIKKETKLANIYEGDTQLTGKTLAEATVHVAVANSEKFALGKSDINGNIILDIKELDLKKDQKVVITITGVTGGKVEFEKTVLGKIVSTNVVDKTPSSTNWIDSTIGKIYPKTGEGKQPIFIIVGMVALSASGWIYFKKR